MATAKKTTTTKKPATKKATAKKNPDSAASAGPLHGTLETKTDAVKAPEAPAKVGKATEKAKVVISKSVEEQFEALAKALSDTNTGIKQPRQLRWALKSLDAAKDAALRHIQHNV